MRAFKFSLQKLLNTKLAFEKECELRLARHLSSLELTERKLKQLKRKRQSELERAQKRHRKTNRHELSIHACYLNWLDNESRKQEMAIIEKNRTIAETRTQLGEIIRERKTLENLMKKERKQWLLTVRREESKEMDEFAVGSFIRRHRAI